MIIELAACPPPSGRLIRHGTRRCVRAILEGLDDRLLVCIEPRLPLADAPAAGRRIAAWRAAYGDELEVLAFVRSSHGDETDCEAAHACRAVARCWHQLRLPLVVGLASARPAEPKNGRTAPEIEQWTWPANDVRLLLSERHPSADLLLARGDRQRTDDARTFTPGAPRLALGCGEPYDACMQAALVEQLAADCACGLAQSCGIVIAWCADQSAAATASHDHPLLSALAEGVRYRRLAHANRQRAPLRSLAHCCD